MCVQTSAVVMNGIVRPAAPAKTSPTIIKMAEVIPFFAATPKIKPSANSNTIEMIEFVSMLIAFALCYSDESAPAINGCQ